MIACRYRIVLDGELDPASALRFEDVRLRLDDGHTVIETDEIDQPGLNGLLERLRLINAVLVALERLSVVEIPRPG